MFAMSRSSVGNTVFFSLLSLSLFCGCGGSQPWENVYPVKGVVTHKGKPVKDAEIRFFPVDGKFPESVRPWAKSNENGEFVVSTYNRDDGAPAGAYKVTVVHHDIVVSGELMSAKPNDLPKKYATQTSTDLIVDVAQGATTLPSFDLQ